MGIVKALITGASRGIGRELALLLAEKGIQLILVARNWEAASQTKDLAIRADLATQDGVAKVCAVIEQEAPDLVVNNAAVGFYGPCIEQETDSIQINCQALVMLSQCAAKACIQNKKAGIILNVSSVLGFFPTPYAAVYAASKSFVNSFSKAFDAEVRGQGVRVLCACPGQVATDFCVHASGGRALRPPHGMVLDPKNVAEALWKQIQKKKSLQVIDWKYRLLVGVCRFIPNSFIEKMLSKTMRSRRP